MIFLEGVDVTSMYITGQAVYYVIAIALYFLMSYGFYRMAKKRNIDKAYIAFIPCARYVIAGKVIGDAIVFGRRTNKLGLIVAIVSGIYFVTSLFLYIYKNYWLFCAIDADLVVDLSLNGQYIIHTNKGVMSIEMLMTKEYLNVIAKIVNVISMIASLAWIVFIFMLWNNLFVKFKPISSFMYSFLAVIIAMGTYSSFAIPLEIAGLFVFIFRNRDSIKLNIYAPYDNPAGYNNYDPYGRSQQSYDPYGRNNNNQGGQAGSQKDPFEEFGDNKDNDSSNPFGM